MTLPLLYSPFAPSPGSFSPSGRLVECAKRCFFPPFLFFFFLLPICALSLCALRPFLSVALTFLLPPLTIAIVVHGFQVWLFCMLHGIFFFFSLFLLNSYFFFCRFFFFFFIAFFFFDNSKNNFLFFFVGTSLYSVKPAYICS